MEKYRKIKKIIRSKPTLEGAGVKLKRVFSHNEIDLLDPFLLLDHFGSDNPDDYMAGFPWHPHRGIETITYMLKGKVEHGDSLGNSGVIESGDVQWMTAGSGIIHQEMPKNTNGLMQGFQLWANLPRNQKMMNPRYRDIKKDMIPEIVINDKIVIKIVSGKINDVEGPVKDIVINPTYLDITMEPNSVFQHSLPKNHTAFSYIFEGEAYFDETKDLLVSKEHLVIFDSGEMVNISTKQSSARFLLVSGKPLKEPIVWYGPIVMNTQDEIRIAFEEYRNGTFIKSSKI